MDTAKGPKRKVLHSKTQEEVSQKLTKPMANRDGGLVFDAEHQIGSEYLERWLQDSVRGSVKPITYENYELLVRVHILPSLGRLRLKALSPPQLQAFYRSSSTAVYHPALCSTSMYCFIKPLSRPYGGC